MIVFRHYWQLLVQDLATAHKKWRYWLGAIVAFSPELRQQWPQIATYFPDWHWIHVLASHFYIVLGILVALSTIKRTLKLDEPHAGQQDTSSQ